MNFKEDLQTIFKKDCKVLFERSERIFALLCTISILLAMTTPRLHNLTNINLIQTYLKFFHVGVAICASFIILIYRPKHFLLVASSILLVILQSFSFLYWPSLNFGTPVQDYYLMDQVSSNYSFDQGMRYLRNITIFLFPVWALWLLSRKKLFLKNVGWLQIISGKNAIQTHAVLLAFLAFALLLNSGVAIYQGVIDLNFLLKGSGSAIWAGRAPALLEDSGASNVFFAALLSGVIYLIFDSSCYWPQKIIWSLIFIVGLLGGIASKGRIFFISFGISLVILFFLLILKGIFRRNYTVFLAPILIFLTIVIVWNIAENHYPYAVSTIKQFQTVPELLNQKESFSELMRSVDPVRGVHMKTMTKAFFENPVFGTGYGSFYMNYFEHRQWAEKLIGKSYADPPSSLYLMFVSEFGIAGFLLILLKLLTLANGWRRFVNSSPIISEKTNSTLIQSFSVGVLTSLAISFLIGLHLIFMSVSSVFLLSLFFVYEVDREGSKKKKSVNILIYSIVGFSMLLMLSATKQWWTVPPSAAFRWKERGKPQVPVDLKVPIKTPGQGTWLVSGAEVILSKPGHKLFVELPPEYYPLTVEYLITTHDRKFLHENKHVIYNYKLPSPGEVIEIDFDYTSCLPATISNYCTIQVKTNPPWKWHGKNIGYYFF